MEWLETAVKISIVAGFIGGVFSFMVLRPLNATIQRLERTVDKLYEQVSHADERRQELELKVVEIDQRARSAHHRIDGLAEFCKEQHGGKWPDLMGRRQ